MNKYWKPCEWRDDFGFLVKSTQWFWENMEWEMSPVFNVCNECSRKTQCIQDKEENMMTAIIVWEANDVSYHQKPEKFDSIEFNQSQNTMLKFSFDAFAATVEKVGYKFWSDNRIKITEEHNEAVVSDLKQDFFLSISQYIAVNSNETNNWLLETQVLNQIKIYIPKINLIFEQYYLD